jgi:hypothetical protein
MNRSRQLLAVDRDKGAKESTMSPTEMTLHEAIEKWLAPAPAMRVHVVRIRAGMHGRCVCVEAIRSDGPLSIFFFRHDDGWWNVYPPAQARPAMSVWRTA